MLGGLPHFVAESDVYRVVSEFERLPGIIVARPSPTPGAAMARAVVSGCSSTIGGLRPCEPAEVDCADWRVRIRPTAAANTRANSPRVTIH